MRIDDNLHGMTVRKTNKLFLFSVKCPVFSEEVIIKEIRRKTGGLGRRLIISNSQLTINNSQLGFLSIIASSLNTGH